jgi:hypothetical protein
MTLDLEAQVALIREWNAAVIAEAGESRTPEDEHCLREWSRHKALPKNRAEVASTANSGDRSVSRGFPDGHLPRRPASLRSTAW